MNVRNFALLHEPVERHAETAPDHLAVDEGGRTITYGALREAMERLAAVLLENGLERGGRAGIYLENGIDAYTGMLGAMRSGGCYVPVPPAFPAERNAAIVADAQPFALVTARRHLERLAEVAAHLAPGAVPLLIVLDMSAEELEGPGAHETARAAFGAALGRDALAAAALPPRAVATIEEDLAYLLYTSGTTGKPKGAMLSHRNVASFLRWAVGHFELGPRDRLSNHSNLSFDVSVFDIFGGFFAGATVCPLMTAGDRAYPARFIKDRRITVWFSVPNVLGLMIAARQLTPGAFSRHLRHAIFAGEPLAPEHVAAWLETHPEVPISNLYGPTEAAVSVTHHRVGVDAPFDPHRPVPIGKPCRDVEILVLKLDSNDAADVGEVGRLMICGTQVCAGYWRRPDLTAAAFQVNPFKSEFGARMYDSGDLAFKDAEGTIHFVGRRDSQVKFMGYRIELGEIETALRRAAGVAEAAVVLLEGPPPMLVGAVAVHAGAEVSEEGLFSHCETLVPAYMVPRRIDFFPALPKNDNGKIDRKAIKAACLSRNETEGGPRP